MPSNASVVSHLSAIWRSYRSLPFWVQLWVAVILVPVNLASLGFLNTWAGSAAAWALALVAVTNLPIMYVEQGLGRLMAIPHLLIWGPLELLLALRLFGFVGAAAPDSLEVGFIVVLLIVNGISLICDAIDTLRWCHGERSFAGVD